MASTACTPAIGFPTQCGGRPAGPDVLAPGPGTVDATVPPTQPLAFAADPFTDGKDVDTPNSSQLGPSFSTPCSKNNDPSAMNDSTLWYITLYNGFGAPLTVGVHGTDGTGTAKVDTVSVAPSTSWLSAARPVYVAGTFVALTIDSVAYTIHGAPVGVRIANNVVWVQSFARAQNVVLLQLYVYEYRPALYFMAERLIKALQNTAQTCLPVTGPVLTRDVPTSNASGAFVGMYNYTGGDAPYTVGLYTNSVSTNQSASAYVYMSGPPTVTGTFTISGKTTQATAALDALTPPQKLAASAANGIATVYFADTDTGAGSQWRVLFVLYGDDRADRYVKLINTVGFTPPRSVVPTIVPGFTLGVMALTSDATATLTYTPPVVDNGIVGPGTGAKTLPVTRNERAITPGFLVSDVSAVPFTLTLSSGATYTGAVDVCTAGTTVQTLTTTTQSSTTAASLPCVYLAVNAVSAVLVVLPQRVDPATPCSQTPGDVTCSWFSSIPTSSSTLIPLPSPAKQYTLPLRLTCVWSVPPCGTPVSPSPGAVQVSIPGLSTPLSAPWNAGVNGAANATVQLLQGVPVTVSATLPGDAGNVDAITFAPNGSARQAYTNATSTMVVTLTDTLLQVFVLGGPGAGSGTLAQDLYNAVSTLDHGDVGVVQLSITALNNTPSSSLTAQVFGCASQELTAAGANFTGTVVSGSQVSAAVQGSFIPTLVCAPSTTPDTVMAPPLPPPLQGTLQSTPSSTVQSSVALLLPGAVDGVNTPGGAFQLSTQGYLVVRTSGDLATATATAWNASPVAPALPPPTQPTQTVHVVGYNVNGALRTLSIAVGADSNATQTIPTIESYGSSVHFEAPVAACIRASIPGSSSTTPLWTADLRDESLYTTTVRGTLTAVSWPRAGNATVVLLSADSDADAAAYKAVVDAAWNSGAATPPTPTAPTPVNVQLSVVDAGNRLSSIAYSVNGTPMQHMSIASGGMAPTQRTLLLPAQGTGDVLLMSGANSGSIQYTAELRTAVEATILADGVTVGVAWPRLDANAIVLYVAASTQAAQTYFTAVRAAWMAGDKHVPLPHTAPPSPSRQNGSVLQTWKQSAVYGGAALAAALGIGFVLGGVARTGKR